MMRRLAYIISTFLIFAGIYGGNVGADSIFHFTEMPGIVTDSIGGKFNGAFMPDEHKQKYLSYRSRIGKQIEIALALKSNGWVVGTAYSTAGAKRQALRMCKLWLRSSSCKIADVNGTSAFIKQRGSSSSSSTASSSNTKEIFCATASYYWSTDWITCSNEGGKAFDSEYQAKAEHKRLKGGSSSSSSTASSSNTKEIFCATASYYWSTDWITCSNEGGKAFDSEYQAKAEHKRLKGGSSSSSSTASSSGLQKVWCGTRIWVSRQTKVFCDASKGAIYSTRAQACASRAHVSGCSTSGSTSTASSSGSKNSWVWCATDALAIEMWESSCRSRDGKAFSHRSQAEAEHKRLKAASSTASSSSSIASTTTQAAQTTTSQPTPVDKSALELAFWQTIQDSDDPDMFREYLRQFPQGVYAGLAKLKVKKLGGDTSTVAQSSIPNLDYGRYHALVIGNNDYDHLPNLKTAVNDATKVASVLENSYGFSVKLLKNASRSNIVSALSAFRKTISRDNNFLLYYAGHGHLDEAANEGYWLPVDAELDDPSNWLQNDTIVAQLRAMEAKHVMVIADSCFSGTITRGINIEQRTPEWLRKIVKKKARIALTSGGLEPVSDFGGGSHSSFAKVFISLLEENTDVLDASQLFSQLRPKVMVNSTQTPEFGKIHLAGDDGGDFLFVRRR